VKVTLTRVDQQSNPVPPQEGSQLTDPSYFWRMTVTDESGNPHAIFVRGLATDRGRNYHNCIGQAFEMTFSGGEITDRDGSVWKKAKLDKPAQGSQGGGGGRSGGGGGRGSSGSSSGSQRPDTARNGESRLIVPRDDFFRRMARLYFEAATSHVLMLAKWKEDERFGALTVDSGAFWEQVGKVANQAAMSMGLECLAADSGQQAEAERLAKEKTEREEAERKEREERENRDRLAREQEQQKTKTDW
jgi:hypothetical protein